MKVAEITTFPWFSVGKIASGIMEYLNSNGSVCKFFYARDYREGDNYIKFANKFEIYFNALLARIFDNDGFCCSFSANKLIKELDNFKPDIVHLHTAHGYYLNIEKLFLYLKKKHIKVVWTMHDTWAITGHCAFFGDGNCEGWLINDCKNCKFKRVYPKSILFNRANKNYKIKKTLYDNFNANDLYIVSPSKWLDSFISRSILNKFEHNVIYNGIDIEKFRDLKLPRKKTLLCIASVWDTRKNIEKVLEISRNLHSWNIIIIGNIPNYIKKDIFSNITFIRRTTSSEELIKFYNSCSVFFNPTIGDNLPTVNIEAQLCGLPVLCFDVGGNKETDCGGLLIIEKSTYIDDYFIDYVLNEMKCFNITKNKFSESAMSLKYYELFTKIVR